MGKDTRQSKYRKAPSRRRTLGGGIIGMLGVIVGFVKYMFSIFIQFTMLLSFVGICVFFLMTIHDSTEEISALSSIKDTGYVELLSTKSVDSSLDGRIVFVQGKVTTSERLKDRDFNISAPVHALAFYREMFFYQWHEYSRQGSISYDIDWSLVPEDTHDFSEYRNNTLILPLKSSTMFSTNNKLGAYTVAASLVSKFPVRHNLSVDLTDELSAQVKEKILHHAGTSQVKSDSMQVYFSESTNQATTPLVHKKADNDLFLGFNVLHPLAGDVFARYTYTPEQVISFFAILRGDTLHIFEDADGNVSASTVRAGLVNIKEVLSETAEINTYTFFISIILCPIIMFLLIFIELQLILPFVEDRKYDFTNSALLHNAKRSFKYMAMVAIPIFLLGLLF